jgi:hypothetical protein|uniref:Uncharacterized protein n=1 Tax=viral metagenome TaxID=1070528 RepID=A0A6C0BP05_9ZZZZ
MSKLINEELKRKAVDMLSSANPAVLFLSNLTKKEKFSTKEHFKESTGGGVLVFFILLLFVIYMMAMIVTWVRLVFIASSCSIGEGVAAFFVTSTYTLWKMGTLIQNDCKKGLF